MTFDELQLLPAVQKAVTEQGYEQATPIQQQAIPIILRGADLLAGAQTGTGKTAAFTLPLLHCLAQDKRVHNRAGGVGVRALILTPTRELAAQVEESIRMYGRYLPLKSTAVFGGVGMYSQITRLRRGVDVLVATPGRLLDLHQQGFLDLQAVQTVVLDEADRMLDMGFIYDVKKILALLPEKRQSLLFSATFSDEIRALSDTLLRQPEFVQVAKRNATVQRIRQSAYLVGRQHKKVLLAKLIAQNQWWQVLIFTRTKFGANHLAEYLERNGVTATALHGNKSQSARTAALSRFKSGRVQALVATDIAARGIDIEDLPYVVNYEVPNVCEDYVHRIGRTGRAGKDGEAITLVSLDEEGLLVAIERFTKQEIERKETPAAYMPPAGEYAQPIVLGRQVIWGGLGRVPSRHAMQAAGRQARQEASERMGEHAARGKPRSNPKVGGAASKSGKGDAVGAGLAYTRADSRAPHARRGGAYPKTLGRSSPGKFSDGRQAVHTTRGR